MTAAALDAGTLRRHVRLVVAIALAWSLLLVGAAIAWGGSELSDRLRTIGWPLALAVFAAFCANHSLRFVRWQMMLRAEGHAVPWPRSLSIFMAGLALLPTPANAGVAARSFFLLSEGVPVHVSLAAYFVERLLDFVGLVVLATLLLMSGAPHLQILLAFVIAAAGVIGVSVAPRVCRALRSRISRPRLARAIEWLTKFFADAADMLAGWRLPLFVLLGLAANMVVAALLWFALRGSAMPLDLAQASGVVGVSYLFGAASLLPGGLGGFELAMLAQLAVLNVPASDAWLALALVRMATLWGSVVVGIPLLFAELRRSER